MTMSSRIAVMHEGRILQIDTPSGIYEYPNNRFVASFLGSVNLFDGKVVEREGNEVVIEAGDGEQFRMQCQLPLAIGLHATVGIRPEKIRLAPDQSPAPNRIKGIVENIAYLGDVSTFHIRMQSGQKAQMTLTNLRPITEQTLTWGEEVMLEWDPDGGVVLAE